MKDFIAMYLGVAFLVTAVISAVVTAIFIVATIIEGNLLQGVVWGLIFSLAVTAILFWFNLAKQYRDHPREP